MISARLLEIVRCPDCGGRLHAHTEAKASAHEYIGGASAHEDVGSASAREGFGCASCGRSFAALDDFLDLRPRDPHAEQTKYLDEALHADARFETAAPPVLGAAIRNDMLREFLRPVAGDRIVDLGCGNGKVLLWNADTRAYRVGVDVSPYFSREARSSVDLVLGDLRRLPFADGSFSKAYALDVLEHLSRDSLASMLREAARVLEPGGHLFVYSHVRKNSVVAVGLKAINRLARLLERIGWVDLAHERLRKSDHVNPLADIPDLRRVTGDTGFSITRIRYYTPLVGGFVENILVRIGERVLGSGAGGQAKTGGAAGDEGRARIKRRISRRGPLYALLRTLTLAMKLDLVLFGRVESGPFFALLKK